MSVKQIPLKISAVIVDWDGTITSRLAKPILDFPLRLFREAINIQQEIEFKRGTRNSLSKQNQLLVDELTAKTPVHSKDSPIIQLLEILSQNHRPWFIVSDHSTHEKIRACPSLKPICQIACSDYALKPLSDAFYPILCQLQAPRHELLYIGDRFDTDGHACEQIGIPFLPVSALNHDLVKEIILRF